MRLVLVPTAYIFGKVLWPHKLQMQVSADMTALAIRVLCFADGALRQHMFYIQFLYGDRHMYKKICDYTRIPLLLRGPRSSTCLWTPSLHSVFYSVWFTVLYLWANRPKLTALEKACRCTLQVHHNVTHIAQPLSTTQSSSPKTPIISTVQRCTWPPTLNMEMLWKQNLNIYIRWLQRGVMLFFLFSRSAVCISRRGGEAETRERKGSPVCTEWREATFWKG